MSLALAKESQTQFLSKQGWEDGVMSCLISSNSISPSASRARPTTVLSQRLPPTRIAETTPDRIPIGAQAKIKFSSHVVLWLRNWIVTRSPKRVSKGPGDDSQGQHQRFRPPEIWLFGSQDSNNKAANTPKSLKRLFAKSVPSDAAAGQRKHTVSNSAGRMLLAFNMVARAWACYRACPTASSSPRKAEAPMAL